MKIAFIGGGNMGEAMLAAILGKSWPHRAISASAISAGAPRIPEKKYGVAVTPDERQAVSGKDIIVLAVKPQSLPEVMAGIKGSLKPAQLVLSIIAGVRIATSPGLGHSVSCAPCPIRRRGSATASAAGRPPPESPKSKRDGRGPSWVPWAKRFTSMTRSTWIWSRRSAAAARPISSSSPRP